MATLLVPALGARRLRLGAAVALRPFFLALVLLGLLVMAAGFPPGTPLRKGVTFTYNHLSPVQFLRTTHKAGPLVVLAPGLPGGLRRGGAGLRGSRARRAAGAGARRRGAAGGLGLAADHRARHRRPDGDLDGVPAAWQRTADDLDRGLAANARAAGAPGPAAGLLRLGQHRRPDPARPDRPAGGHRAVRAPGRPALRRPAVDHRRPGAAGAPGARPAAAAAAPDRRCGGGHRHRRRARARGAMPAADAARELAGQGLGRRRGRLRARALASRGTDGGFEPVRAAARGAPPRPPGARGIVRVEPAGPATVVDGSADGAGRAGGVRRAPSATSR